MAYVAVFYEAAAHSYAGYNYCSSLPELVDCGACSRNSYAIRGNHLPYRSCAGIGTPNIRTE